MKNFCLSLSCTKCSSLQTNYFHLIAISDLSTVGPLLSLTSLQCLLFAGKLPRGDLCRGPGTWTSSIGPSRPGVGRVPQPRGPTDLNFPICLLQPPVPQTSQIPKPPLPKPPEPIVGTRHRNAFSFNTLPRLCLTFPKPLTTKTPLEASGCRGCYSILQGNA